MLRSRAGHPHQEVEVLFGRSQIQNHPDPDEETEAWAPPEKDGSRPDPNPSK